MWVVVVELTRFLDAGRKSLGFSLAIEIDLVVVWVVDIDFSAGGRAWLDFSLGIEIDMVCVLA